MFEFVYLIHDGKIIDNVEITNSHNAKQDIDKHLNKKFKSDDFYLIHNGKRFLEDDPLVGEFVHVTSRLPGGKGGFGSMLRAIGAQIEKTTNREACRDLSGRRLRDINEEQRLKKWVSEQADREREREERKKKKLERLKQEPKHEFKDADYDKVRAEMMDKVHSAVEEGLKAACAVDDEQPSTSSGVKRKLEVKEKKSSLLWIDDLGSDLSDSDEDGEDEAKKKIKTV